MQFYVSQSGDDLSGDGSIDLPWQSIAHAVGSIPQDAVTLNLRSGTYRLADTLRIENYRGGLDNARLVIRSYEGENAILDGGLIAEFGSMISIRDSDNIFIENLELTNLIGNKSGIHVTGDSSGVTLSNNKIHAMHWTTDAAAAAAPAPTDNLNPVVIVGDSQNTMRDISILNNKIYDLTTGYSEAVKVTGNIDGFLIESNEVHDVSNIGIVAAGNYAWVGLEDAGLNHARNGVIRNNEVYRCVSPVAASAGIYVDGARSITVIDNNSHHNTVGISVGSEQPGEASAIVVANNVATDNTQAGIVVGTISADSMVDDVRLTGNELRGNYTSPVWGGAPIIINKSKNIHIEENKISSISQYMLTVNAASDQLHLDNNRYQSTAVSADQAIFSWLGISNENYTGFEKYQLATGQDARSTFGNSGSVFTAILESIKGIF